MATENELVDRLWNEIESGGKISNETLSEVGERIPELTTLQANRFLRLLHNCFDQIEITYGGADLSQGKVWERYSSYLDVTAGDTLHAPDKLELTNPDLIEYIRVTKKIKQGAQGYNDAQKELDKLFSDYLDPLYNILLTDDDRREIEYQISRFFPNGIDSISSQRRTKPAYHARLRISLARALQLCKVIHDLVLKVNTLLGDINIIVMHFPVLAALILEKRELSVDEIIDHHKALLKSNPNNVEAVVSLFYIAMEEDRGSECREYVDYLKNRIESLAVEDIDCLCEFICDHVYWHYCEEWEEAFSTHITDVDGCENTSVDFWRHFLWELEPRMSETPILIDAAYSYFDGMQEEVPFNYLLGKALSNWDSWSINADTLLAEILGHGTLCSGEDLKNQPGIRLVALKKAAVRSVFDILLGQEKDSWWGIDGCTDMLSELCEEMIMQGQENNLISFIDQVEEMFPPGIYPGLSSLLARVRYRCRSARAEYALPDVPELKELLLLGDIEKLRQLRIERDAKYKITGIELLGLIRRVADSTDHDRELRQIRRQNDILLLGQVNQFIYDGVRYRALMAGMKGIGHQIDRSRDDIIEQIHEKTVENFQRYHVVVDHSEVFAKCIGGALWANLHNDTKMFLNIAHHLYEANKFTRLDEYGFIAIEYCKAMEMEFQSKIFDCFFGKGRGFSGLKDDGRPTLGSICYILKSVKNGDFGGNNVFAKFCQRKGWARGYLREVLRTLNNITTNYRNPAAHPSQYDMMKLRELRNILLDQGFLKLYFEMWVG